MAFMARKNPEKITAHGNFRRHLKSFTTCKEMEKRLKKEYSIDAQL